MKITTTRIHKTKSQKKKKGNIAPMTRTDRAQDAHLEDRSALSNFWVRLTKTISLEKFEGSNIHMSAGMANDNTATEHASLSTKSRLVIAACVIGIIAIGALNFSAIATQVMMNADGQVLDHVMTTNPEALAFALNAMNVGE